MTMLERLKDERCLPKMSRSENARSNDIEFSGERKRVRCNELLGGHLQHTYFGGMQSAGEGNRTTVATET
jgi:hypothetical protein